MKTNHLTCQKCSKNLDWEKDLESWEANNICYECTNEQE